MSILGVCGIPSNRNESCLYDCSIKYTKLIAEADERDHNKLYDMYYNCIYSCPLKRTSFDILWHMVPK